MTIMSLLLAFYGNPLSGKPRSMIPLPAPTSDRVCRTPFCLHTHQRGAQSHTCRQPGPNPTLLSSAAKSPSVATPDISAK
jgi:hypothetical protein